MTTQQRFSWSISLMMALLASFCPYDAFCYDYSAPMKGFSALPLDYPQMPFVLRFSREQLLRQQIWAGKVDGILIAKDSPESIRIGAVTLRNTINQNNLGSAIITEIGPSETAVPAKLVNGRYIALGVPANFHLLADLAKKGGLQITDKALNGDGFIIKPLTQGKNNILLITSPVARGVLYGAYEVEERTTHRGVPLIDQPFIPAVRYRSWPIHAFTDEPADSSGRLRLNLSVTFDLYWNSLLFYKDYPMLGGEQKKAIILENQRKLHEHFARAVKYGAMPTMMWNPLGFCVAPVEHNSREPQAAMDKAHPGMAALPGAPGDAGWRYNLCPSHPETRKYVEGSVKEMIHTFPEIEMLGFYLSDQYGELICNCDRCKKYPYIDRVVDYSQLIMKSAREVNPKIRFMMRIHALNMFIPVYHPQYLNDPSAGMRDVVKRLGKDMEAVEMRPTTPPGGDFQSWLAPQSTMLGTGVPIYFFFHYYEAGGPGTVAPISPVMSHLSWALPLYVERLNKFIQPGQGVIGAACPVAGMEVAFWYPNLDAGQYMKNWCQAKYGEKGGNYVAEALVDTDKITEKFYLETKKACVESFDVFRWGEWEKPWPIDMGIIDNLLQFKEKHSDKNILSGVNPHARQPEELRNITSADKDRWLQRFEMKEEMAIAERARVKMAKALKTSPDNPEIQRLDKVARATLALTKMYKEYHLALVLTNLARNTNDKKIFAKLAKEARPHLKEAIDQTMIYTANLAPLGLNEKKHMRLRGDLLSTYIVTTLCDVREAAFLFTRDFGGENLLEYYDRELKSLEKSLSSEV